MTWSLGASKHSALVLWFGQCAVGHPSGQWCACVHSHHSVDSSNTIQAEAPPASTTTTQSNLYSTAVREREGRCSAIVKPVLTRILEFSYIPLGNEVR